MGRRRPGRAWARGHGQGLGCLENRRRQQEGCRQWQVAGLRGRLRACVPRGADAPGAGGSWRWQGRVSALSRLEDVGCLENRAGQLEGCRQWQVAGLRGRFRVRVPRRAGASGAGGLRRWQGRVRAPGHAMGMGCVEKRRGQQQNCCRQMGGASPGGRAQACARGQWCTVEAVRAGQGFVGLVVQRGGPRRARGSRPSASFLKDVCVC